jgi:hypothetical protein
MCHAAFARSPLDDFSAVLEASEEAAVIKIDSFKQVKNGEQDCGFLYSGTVVEGLKGSLQGSISFGFRGGLLMGKEYKIYFLSGMKKAELRDYIVEALGHDEGVDKFVDLCDVTYGVRYWIFSESY